MAEKKICFIVTPIGDDNSSIRRHIDGVIEAAIKPALEEKFEVQTPHGTYKASTITKDIYQSLYESDLVIANLTGLNPNVMYELAIRFCIGKPTILIAENGTKLPFDVKDQRTLFYENDLAGTLELKAKIIESEKTIDYDAKPTSPIHDTIKEIKLFDDITENDGQNTIEKKLNYIMRKLDKIKLTSETNSGSIKNRHKIYDLTSENAFKPVDQLEFHFETDDLDGTAIEII